MTSEFACGAPAEIRDRLALALDVATLAEAEDLALRLAPWFGIGKVGLELYGAAGPAAFDALHDLGFQVFADLKLHDIPSTVGRAAAAIARHGVEYLDFHATGGEVMMRAGADAFHNVNPRGIALAVTVLTSDPEAGAFDERLAAARAAGCDGVVCSAHELDRVGVERLRAMVPGVRLPGGDTHDQARVATPAVVARAGGEWAVVGRAVTAASDPGAAAAAIAESFASGLA